ncbi:hypothetical protein ACSVH2_02080 [Flavobacterium sp. RSB2_4_14]|uniref:hypothetical protein n=1 Tax=Flavobacterium sp. RSB2_4_14 TaxID=3447665 RepID=UPI003F412A6C
MIVFQKELLENTFLYTEAKRLNSQKFISDNQLKDIKGQLPILKSNTNLLIRTGFFLLGSFLYSSIIGVFSLFTINLIDSHVGLIMFIYTIVGIVASEFLAREQLHYGFGVDDAFILGFQGFFCAAISITFESPLVAFIALGVIGFAACVRYLHTFSALLSLIGFIGAICYLVIEKNVIDTSFLPFILFFLAVIFYAIYTKISTSIKLLYYENSIMVLQGVSLLLGYFSMNYLVVRELSESLLGLTIAKGEDIPFAFVFYGFTFLIPLFYIVYSLYSKDKLMLLIGFFTLGFSVFTIRYYYQVLPIELALMIGGVLIFIIAYFGIRMLKDKETGITFKPARSSDIDLLTNLEALVVNSQDDLKPMDSQSKMPFGGGGFSGGGSGESF